MFFDTQAHDAPSSVRRFIPCLEWLQAYNGGTAASDALAAVVVTIMLIPQSLAYAMLAGLPPQVGLYASILPLVAYAIFGTSRVLAVGPVAVVSLMTATAVSQVAVPGSAAYVTAAIALAFLSGLFLILMGVLRLGFIANFLSHPVISGFITASGLLIAASQLKHVLGIQASGQTLVQFAPSFVAGIPTTNLVTLAIGVVTLIFLLWARKGLASLLQRLGLRPRLADMASKAGPVVAVIMSTFAVWTGDLARYGVAIVGDVPRGLPAFNWPAFDPALWRDLVVAAVLISIIGFVESISIAQTLAAKRRQRIDPDQELVGLGAANVASALSGGYPVTGGFARSVVNFDAGAQTPAAGVFTAIGIALVALYLTPWLYFLPQATLAATVIVAVLSLVDLKAWPRIWRYSKSDFTAMITTIAATLAFGVETGVLAGVALSVLLHLYRTSRPHCAVVGLVPGTEHFRNVKRHDVIADDRVVTLRVDESLYFANARFLEDRISQLVAENPKVAHVILMCPAVNEIDASALESLEAINDRLKAAGVKFHLSEVKGPVMDRLQKTDFLQHLTGQVYLSQYQAFMVLSGRAMHGAMI
jgi:SulP family sulfate permease